MNDFIQMAVGNLGLSEDSARSATGGLLQLIQSQVGGDDARHLLNQLPGSQELLNTASAGSSGGGLGGLVSKIGGMFGGKAGAAAGIVGILDKTGLGVGKIGPFASLFVNFLRDKAGTDLVDRVLNKLPELKKLMG